MGIHWYLVLGCFLALCLDANQDIPCPPGNELDGQHGGIQYAISNQQSFSLEFNPKNQKTFSRVLSADGNVVTYDDKEFEGRFDYDGESVNMWHLKSSHAGTYRMIDSENKCLATWTITWPDLDRITSPPGRNSTAVSPMPVSVKGQDPLDAGGSISVFTGELRMGYKFKYTTSKKKQERNLHNRVMTQRTPAENQSYGWCAKSLAMAQCVFRPREPLVVDMLLLV
uniref:Uncharacterized protein LOC117349824 n=1 Tax=Geotrypetes seraphini TaxID=260995 RepID=A0A6P8PVI8_GEOSA|nr:uncharacterized protein LOC117349824 [Geotrypetes seraphini]